MLNGLISSAGSLLEKLAEKVIEQARQKTEWRVIQLNRVQIAVGQIKTAIEQLKFAKANLLHARSDQHVHLAVQLAALEEIHGILTDPECTPEIAEPERED